MVVGIVHLFVRRILIGQSVELLLAEDEVVELVFEDDAAVVQSVHNDEVAGLHLFFGERNLCQVVFAFVRIVLCAVGDILQRVGQRLGLHDGVALLVGKVLQIVHALSRSHHRLVDALPVVDVLALTPLFLEGLLTLIDGQCVIEIPLPVFLLVLLLHGLVLLRPVALCPVFLHHLFRFGFLLLALLFLLFLDECLDDAVDGSIAVFLVHLRQLLQRVLQMDGIGKGHQVVEHLRAIRQLFVVVALLV